MSDPFPPNSRYFGLPEQTVQGPDGASVPYLARRVVPAPSRFTAFDRRRLNGTERIDALAVDAYGDPELYWRIADANAIEDPGAPLAGGTLLNLPLPLETSDNGDT